MGIDRGIAIPGVQPVCVHAPEDGRRAAGESLFICLIKSQNVLLLVSLGVGWCGVQPTVCCLVATLNKLGRRLVSESARD